ncbi:hypothetical protein [Helicobacter sp. T3_23-1056]
MIDCHDFASAKSRNDGIPPPFAEGARGWVSSLPYTTCCAW